MLFLYGRQCKKFRPSNGTTHPYGSNRMSDIKDQNSRTTSQSAARLGRRQFLKAAGLATGGLLAAPGLLRHISIARAADRTQISFASAKFFAKSTVGQVVEAFNEAQGKILVKYDELPPPSASTEVHQGLVQRLAKKDGSPDVFTQDVIWIAEFAGAGWALPLDEYISAAEANKYFPGVLAACRWRGKLTALPWFVDSGMLYYRTDLLSEAGAGVPETWDQLVSAAQAIVKAGKAKIGFSWQAKQAEVLICDLVEFVSSNRGSILGSDGKTVKIADPEAVDAVQFMYDTIAKYKISPADVRSWDEEPSRVPFTGGDAAFLRNWSYVYPISQDPKTSTVVGKVGVAPLPHFPGGKSAACLGGYQYGVNASTKKREAAVEFLKWLSDPATQLRFATELGLAPTRPEVFDSAELAKAQPFMQTLKPVFVGATPRPVTPKYAQVTLALQSAVSQAVTNGNVKEALGAAKSKLEKIVG
jgi:multiple sugar transport system substrate-binding protein